MQIFKHMIENLFVTATGIAALIHSTWSLGTLLSGKQPDPSIDGLGFLGWIVPALLIAFALDIGQIYTSAEIRNGDKRLVKYITFGVFAVATYYLQWLYMAHHIPLLGLEAGIRPDWEYQVTLLRDMAIWIVPAFMPLSTALYTISQRQETETHIEVEAGPGPFPGRFPGQRPSRPLEIEQPDVELLPDAIEEKNETETLPEYDEEETEPYEPIEADNADSHYHNLTCPDCGWETGSRLRLDSAERALRTHQARYCNLLVESE